MKKIFAVFCAVFLMPAFSAQAWIGGPFSNGSHFGASGADGVYEAVATGANTLGYYRIVIGNNTNPGIGTPTTTTGTGAPSINGVIASGNVVLGALGNQSTTFWYSGGVAYAGRAFGTVSFATNQITGIATADDVSPSGYGGNETLNSFFTASFVNSGSLLPSRAFSGTGEFTLIGTGTTTVNSGPFPLVVYGTKVSYQLQVGL